MKVITVMFIGYLIAVMDILTTTNKFPIQKVLFVTWIISLKLANEKLNNNTKSDISMIIKKYNDKAFHSVIMKLLLDHGKEDEAKKLAIQNVFI